MFCLYVLLYLLCHKSEKMVSFEGAKLFDNGEEHIFVVTAAVAIDIIGQRRAKRFFVLFFDGLERPLNVSLETRV